MWVRIQIDDFTTRQPNDLASGDPRMCSDDALTTGRFLARERYARHCVEWLSSDYLRGTFVIENVNVIPRFDSSEVLYNVDVTVKTRHLSNRSV